MMTLVAAPAVADAIRAYVAELAAEDVPLTAEVTVACVLADIARLAGVPLPAPVAAALVAEVTPTGGR